MADVRYFRQGWLGIIGDVVTFGPPIWRYLLKPILAALSLGGDVDFILEHSKSLGWLTNMIDLLNHPIAQFLLIVAGLGLIYFDQKRQNKSARHLSSGRQSKMWPIVLIWVGALAVLGGLTWIYFDYRSSQNEIVSALRRYVLPRHLSEEQKATISGYLRNFPPVKNAKIQVQKEAGAIDRPMGEPSGYAQDIREALTFGGWEVGPTTWGDVQQDGIAIQYVGPQSSPAFTDKNPRPDAIATNAFRAAKILVGGSSSSGADEPTLTILVGKRRLDDLQLIGRRRARENYLRQADELKDEE